MSMIKIHNVETGEVIEREMTPEEQTQAQKDLESKVQQEKNEQAQLAARQAILDRLGLTEDEAKLLLG